MHVTIRSLLVVLSLSVFFVVANATLPPIQAQGGAPGGFLEPASSSVTRPRLSASQIAAFLPSRGVFTFPAPYNTQGIRLTNGTDCPGTDCVLPTGYSFWRRINNHVGSETLLAVLTLDRNRGGGGPTLFSYNKSTGVTTKVGPLFDSSDPRSWAHGEMFYFSGTRPNAYYIHDGPRLMRYDVLAKTTELVVDVSTHISGTYIWQPHSSHDDRVHSFTVRNNSDYSERGCGVYDESTRAFSFFNKAGDFDECQIDKSGRYLVIKQNVDGADSYDNQIIDLATGAQRILTDPAGAGGHSDTGFGYMVAEDNWNSKPGAARLWRLDLDPNDPANGKLVFHAMDWSWGANHISHTNAVSAAPEQQIACSSEVTRNTIPHGNEIICFKLDGSLQVLVVAPVMTDLNASGGGDDYYKAPKGNLDVTGEYMLWTSNMGGPRIDAFIVRVPKHLLGGGGGGGGGVPPPPAPTAYTLSIARPSRGTILGPEIFCGDGGTACSVTKPAGSVIELMALPTGANVLANWGGCAPSFTLSANRSCTPVFSGAAPPPPAPAGTPTLSIVRPSGGTILGPEIFCGDGGAACSVTKPAGTVIELLALPSGSNSIASWGGCAPALTLNSNLSCTPTFSGAAIPAPPAPPPPAPPPPVGGGGVVLLSIARVPGGTIVGPSIFCGDMGGACEVGLPANSYVELAVIVSPGNTFSGWSTCSGAFVIDRNFYCTPVYNGAAAPAPPPPPPGGGYTLSIVNPGLGGGGGFILGPEMVCEPGNVGRCTLSFPGPQTVTLIPIAYPGFSFGGWVEPGCANVMTITGPRTCTADFNRN